MTGIEFYQQSFATGTSAYVEYQRMLAKVRYYCVAGAIAVLTEDAGTENHANRVLWAKKVMRSELPIETALIATISQLTSPDAASDSEVESAVYSIINPMSMAEA